MKTCSTPTVLAPVTTSLHCMVSRYSHTEQVELQATSDNIPRQGCHHETKFDPHYCQVAVFIPCMHGYCLSHYARI